MFASRSVMGSCLMFKSLSHKMVSLMSRYPCLVLFLSGDPIHYLFTMLSEDRKISHIYSIYIQTHTNICTDAEILYLSFLENL